jgi:hypothetical protein
MNPNQRKSHGQIEITDLVAEAVSNAAARRNQVLDSEEPLSLLSDEQTGSVTGGQILPPPFPCPGPVIVMGIIASDWKDLKS